MSMSHRKGKMIKMSEKVFNEELNKAYLDGYKKGYESGVNDGILKKHTPNQLREIFDLPPIQDRLKSEEVKL